MRKNRTQAAAVAALLLASSAHASFFSSRPRWTRAKPHFETRNGHRIAVAVGTAKDENPALARSSAEDRALAELLKLLQGKPAASAAEGQIKGARPVDVYNAGGGTVYVRLELDVTSPAAP